MGKTNQGDRSVPLYVAESFEFIEQTGFLLKGGTLISLTHTNLGRTVLAEVFRAFLPSSLVVQCGLIFLLSKLIARVDGLRARRKYKT